VCTGAGAAGQVQRGSGEGSRGSGEGLGGFGAEPGEVQQGSVEGSAEGLGGFGAEPGQVQQDSGRFRKVPEKVPEKAWEALLQSQVKFNTVSEKVPEKVWEALVQSQVRFNRVPEKVPDKVPGRGLENTSHLIGVGQPIHKPRVYFGYESSNILSLEGTLMNQYTMVH